MTGNQELVNLYSKRILALAAAIPLTERLEDADATIRKRSPLCGSTVTVEIKVNDGRVVEFAQDVKACALGQAAASVVGRNIVGCDLVQIETVRDQLSAMLKNGGPVPDSPFGELEVLLPAREYKNRHASILLTLDASVDAFQSANNRACA
jgi:NifU-like protein involved in Fe-S cluster formation